MTIATSAATILFPTGNVRLVTILAFSAFLALALARRSWLPVAACIGWLFGFEVALDATMLALGRPPTLDAGHLALYLLLGIGLPIWTARRGTGPSLPLLAAAVAVWVVWLGTGFHVNEHSMVGFDPAAEAWNELAKLLWAAAYFLPVWKALAGAKSPVEIELDPSRSPEAALSGRNGNGQRSVRKLGVLPSPPLPRLPDRQR
jgi:hypothetical protein